jgi:hypothetical protein
MAARVCIALADGSMLLFVGEGPWKGVSGEYDVAGFRWRADGGKAQDTPAQVSVRLDGPVVHYPTHDAFVDLEKGLAGAQLLEAELVLEFRRERECHGILRGYVRIGDLDLKIDERAVCEPGGRRARSPRSRLRLHLTSGWPEPRSFETIEGREQGEEPAIRIGGTDGSITVCMGEAPPLDGVACLAVPVYRPLPDGSVDKVTFGTVGYVCAGNPAFGVYERVDLFGPGEA